MAKIDTGKIAYCQIYPGVGIARIGNSPDEFYIGPEAPGQVMAPATGFKDKAGRIKRQAARFRLYAFDKDNVCIGELLADDTIDITWTVHLANAKASYNTFLGRFWQSQYPNFYKYNPNETPLRNQEIMDPAQRQKLLVIDAGPRSIKAGDRPVEFDTGTIGPLPYSDTAPGGAPLEGSRDGWWNCPTKDRLPTPVKMSAKETVKLGTLQVDDSGRLLVLGGYGRSESLIPDNPVGRLMDNNYYANNDYWFDDTSDGPVTAEVRIGGKAVEVRDSAWVLVTPPKFAADAQMPTTLWDTAMETWEKKQNGGKLPDRKVSFTRDIYPILARLAGFTWLNRTAYEHHGANTNNDFANVHSRLFDLLHTKQKSEDVEAATERQKIFGRLRPPGLVAATPQAADTPESLSYASYRFMPQMSGDGGEPQTTEDIPGTKLNPGQINDKVYDCASGKDWPVTPPTVPIPGGYYVTWLTLSDRQYGNMKRWAKGDFDDDWTGVPQPVPFDSIPVAAQPEALNRAAFEPCIGAPFYPGIEITYIATDPALWSGPCRIDAKTNGPGAITRHMAMPWQADFSECNTNWWPTARPDDVIPEEELDKVVASFDETTEGTLARALSVRQPWARGIPSVSPALDNAMIKAWSHFGFVVKREVKGETLYVETERSPYYGSSERDFFYYLMNIDAYPDFVPRAHQLVHHYLDEGRRNMHEPDADEVWSWFPYSQAAFDARMEEIYANFVRDNQTTSNPNLLSDNRAPNEPASQGFQPATYLSTSTREQQAYGLFQMGPFNQLDGAWLRRAIPDGPVDEVGELLAQIRQDELGDGVASQNHANVYTDLLKSLNYYLPDLYTRAYADDPRLLDEAFTQPCFLLAISQFDDEFLPEILGMTLYLEWSSIALVSTVNTLKAFNINPLYYSLHVGIDNASAGHGALAKRAVEIYLDRVRANEGPDAMQKAWERIWTGYVTFGTLGSLGQAITDHFQNNQSLDAKVQALIVSKAPFASQTHGEKTLGSTAINDWFLDPPGFMNELQASGLMVPGRPEISPFFQLLSFNGPMYHVFTADEELLLRDWCVSLANTTPPPQKTLLQAMDYVINTLRQRQVGQAGHNVRITGPDPDKKGAVRTEMVHWWFKKGNRPLMSALANPDNGWIVPFDSVASPIMQSLLAGNGAMATDFRSIVPDTGGQTCGNILAQWIDKGCPLEEPKVALMAAVRRPPKAPVTPHRIYRRKSGKVLGMGTPH
ncbi:LodA/GoxA family CTQ-dependent oxidase [Bradyrhizobium sp. SRS-191]|uniref:LodA/GoxA family CTQ-dependent oxidase n=1 Tax=Bradyrhizobium sp. SRS-191 TaxID=2962606 RepID=UPI00211E4BF1|nr:LodA/GoxA family CTQ-dependent oxidase [Bradyrhizobium sp. SRS-191]